MPPWMIGCSMPSSSVMRVFTARDSPVMGRLLAIAWWFEWHFDIARCATGTGKGLEQRRDQCRHHRGNRGRVAFGDRPTLEHPRRGRGPVDLDGELVTVGRGGPAPTNRNADPDADAEPTEREAAAGNAHSDAAVSVAPGGGHCRDGRVAQADCEIR